MGAKKIADNNMSQDALLRSVKPGAVAVQLDNSLKPNEKALAESILDALLQKSESSDDYMLRLTSKNTDALMGRIETYLEKVKDDFTANELNDVKEAIVKAINEALPATANNATLDVEKAVEQLSTKLDEICQKIVDDVKTALADALKEETPAESVEEFVPEADKQTAEGGADITAITNLVNAACASMNAHIDAAIAKLDTYFTLLSDQIAAVQNKILEAVAGITPSKKDKKAQKQQQNDLKKMSKLMNELAATIGKVNDFIDNFATHMVKHFKKFMDGIFKVLVMFTLKVFGAIVIPVMLLIGLALYLLKDPILELLQPILDFLQPILLKAIDLVGKIFDFVSNKVWPFIENMLTWLRDKIITPVWERVLLPLLDWLGQTFRVFMTNVVIPLLTAVCSALQKFFEGLSEYAYDIGVGLGLFVKEVLNVLVLLMKGFGTQAEAIGAAIGKVVLAVVTVIEKLVKFIGVVVDIISLFFEGFKTQAKAIGEVFGKVILEIAKFVVKLAQFINLVADIIIDFFTPFKPVVKKLAQVIANTLMIVLDLISTVLKGIRRVWNWIRDKLADVKIWKWKPFSFLKGGAPAGNDEDVQQNKDPGLTARINELLDNINSGALFRDIANTVEQKIMSNVWLRTFKAQFSILINSISSFVQNVRNFIRTAWRQLKSGELFKNAFDALANNPTFKKLFDAAALLTDTIRIAIDDISTTITNFIDNFTDILKEAFKVAAEAIVKAVDFLKEKLEQVTGFLGEVKDSIVDSIQNITNIIKNFADNIAERIAIELNSFMGFLREKIDQLMGFFEELKDSIIDSIQNIVSVIKSFIDNLAERIAIFIEDIKPPIIDAIQSISAALTSFIDFLKEKFEQLFDFLHEIKDTFVDGIRNIVDSIRGFIDNLGAKIADFIEAMKVPVLNAIETVKEVITGILQKIGNSIDAFVNEFTLLIRDVKNALVDGIHRIVDGILNLPEKAVGLIVKALKGILNVGKAIGNAVGGAFNKVKGWFSKDKKQEEVQLTPAEKVLDGKLVSITETLAALKENVDFLRQTAEDSFLPYIETGLNFLTNTADAILDLPFMLTDFAIDIGNTIVDIGKGFADAINNVTDGLTALLNNILNIASAGFSEIMNFANTVIASIPVAISSLFDGVKGIASTIINMPVEIAKGLQGILSGITGVVGDLGKGVFNTVTDTVTGITDGIAKLFSFSDDDKAKVTNAALDTVAQGFKVTDSINSDKGQLDLANADADAAAADKKKEKKQKQFNDGLMAFLEQKFGEVLERLDNKEDSQVLPIPMTFNANNPASLENI